MNRILAALLASTVIVHAPAVYAAPRRDVSNQPWAGSLREAARREGTRLAAKSALKAAAQVSPHRRNWAERHPVIVGTLAGAGVGLGIAAASGCESSSDYTCGGVALFFAGTGAGLGAIGGLMVSLFER